jgi:hypothetical protein
MQAITMPPITEIMNLKKSQLFIKFPSTWLEISKFVEGNQFFFIQSIHFGVPWTLPPRAATPLAPRIPCLSAVGKQPN